MAGDEIRGGGFEDGYRSGKRSQKVTDLALAVQYLTVKIDELIPAVAELKVLAREEGKRAGYKSGSIASAVVSILTVAAAAITYLTALH